MCRMEPTQVVIVILSLLGCSLVAPGEMTAQVVQGPIASPSASKGLAAIEAASRSGKYLFIFFWKANDEASRNMYNVFQSTMQKWAESTHSIGIQITDPREKPVVDRFGVSRAPMPLVLALAPNGAITKGFPVKFDENQLRQAFVSPCTAGCLKALQQRKLVLLCVQNQKTQFSQVAMRGAQDFKADARFAKATEIVALDPEDRSEAAFLKDLQVDPRTPTAVTFVLAPPGGPIAKFAGPVTKDQIVAKVSAATSGPCANGQCGPNGCGPKKQEAGR